MEKDKINLCKKDEQTKISSESENIDKITDKIYLGDIEGAKDYKYFESEKIKNVISLLGDCSPKYDEKYEINQKIIKIDDLMSENIIQYFKECIEFIEKSDKIYIHCMCGVSRSVAIVIAYLMWKNRNTYYETYFYVKNKRRYISPNDGFVQQLLIFENLLKKNNYDINKIDFKSVEWPKK